MTQTSLSAGLDLDRLLRLRLTVARHGEMDAARWWNSKGMLGRDTGSVEKTVNRFDWRMYFMVPADVERELLRLHQFRKLHYEVAGSLAQLKLPCASVADYARELAA